MLSKSYILLTIVSLFSLQAFAKPNPAREARTETECKSMNPNYTCYCSRICEWREKHLDPAKPGYDDPVWDGKVCWCKPWDQENFQGRCANKEYNAN